jgi:hypothetical protein
MKRIASIVLLYALLLSGCDIGKKLPVTEGTPATEDEFIAAATKAYSGLNPLSQKVGDYARTINTLRYLTISGPQEVLKAVEGRDLISREVYEDFVLYTFVVRRFEYNGDNEEYIETEETEAYALPEIEMSLAARDLSVMNAEIDPVYNLSYQETLMPIPQAAKETTGCEGDCQIKVRVIKFDTFIDTMDGGKKRIQHEYWISPDVPYMAHELKRCMTYSAQVEAIFVLITECLEVDDYRFGS